MGSRAILCQQLLKYSSEHFYRPSYCVSSIIQQLNMSMYQPQITVRNIKQHEENALHNRLKSLERSYLFHSLRYYAKSRDKKKGDKGHKKKVQVNDEVLAEVINIENMREQMQGAVDKLKEDFIKHLSLRSTSGALESLPVTFEGKNYVLQDVGQVVRKNPKTIVINMAAFPQVIPAVIQAINKSGMNLNPQQDGTTLYVPIPKVTKEHRESLSKNAKGLFTKCKDSIRDVQNKFVKTVKNKEKEGLSKDTAFEVSESILFIGTEYISEAEKILEAKQQELLKEL